MRIATAPLAVGCLICLQLLCGGHASDWQGVSFSAPAIRGAPDVTFYYNPNPRKWCRAAGPKVDFGTILFSYLTKQGERALFELGRLILAQDNADLHNKRENRLDARHPYLLEGKLPGGGPIAEDLLPCASVGKLAEHLFNAGHAGRYAAHAFGEAASAKVATHAARGRFNLAAPLRVSRPDGSEGEIEMQYVACDYGRATQDPPAPDGNLLYTPNQCTLDPLKEIILRVFSGPIGGVLPADGRFVSPALRRYPVPFNPAPASPAPAAPTVLLDADKRILVDFSYRGAYISGLVAHMPVGLRSEIGWNSEPTNQLRLVVGTSRNRISLVSLYPLDEITPPS